jgi:Xaa-Pro aminopeptidase
MSAATFEPFVAAVLSSRPMGGSPTEYAKFFDALAASRARVAVILEPQSDLSTPPGAANQFAAKLRDRFFGFSVVDARPVVADLRQIKTAYEQDVLRKSVLISSEAHRAGMKAAAGGKYEYEVEAATEQEHRRPHRGLVLVDRDRPRAAVVHGSEND